MTTSQVQIIPGTETSISSLGHLFKYDMVQAASLLRDYVFDQSGVIGWFDGY
jgi:hypothetical protein